jgi:hypothetical protein
MVEESGLHTQELHTYAEQTSRTTELRKDNNDGVVKAHLTRTRERDSKESTRVCWNCGSMEHMKHN